jgi:hypothetical protein
MMFSAPQVILFLWLFLGLVIVPANDETYWRMRYSLIARLLRFGLCFALLWWGGFWG